MKGDFTRSTFRATRHYSSVRLQQGRVQLDADWNEQVEIQAHRAESEAQDVIGLCGVPHSGGGFKIGITSDGTDLTISPGRAYVDGILCELEATAAPIQLLAPNQVRLATLLVDERALQPGQWVEVFDADNPSQLPQPLLVVAADPIQGTLTLNAADIGLSGATAPRLRRVTTYLTQPDYPASSPPPTGTELVYLDVWQRHVTALEDPTIREVALGGPDTTTRTKSLWQVRLLPLAESDVNCLSDLPEWNTLIAGSSGALSAETTPQPASDDQCIVPPGAGFRRLENQLYRVEIHQEGALGAATFKWSRDNGTIVTAWLAQDENDKNDLTVSSLGRDALLGFAANQWVELTDDHRELAGQPGTVVQIAGVAGQVLTIDPATRRRTTDSVDLADFPANPKVRRWDSPGELTVEVPSENDGWIELEDGLRIRFADGSYHSGDYWLIPARTVTGEIEWPRDSANRPLAQAPYGIRHHFCRLAVLTAGEGLAISDCRQLFPALTELTSFFYVGGDGQQALPSQPDEPLTRLRQPLQVGVANGQWPLADAAVRFAVQSGAGTVEREDRSDAGSSLAVLTGADGVAECWWRVDSTTVGQQVTATLLDAAGAPLHLPIHFSASLSLAAEVGYTPGGACTNLVGVTTVQQALDELCKTGDNVLGIHVMDVRTVTPDASLLNDTPLPSPLLAGGLRVVCDAPVDAAALAGKLGSKPVCVVTLDLPFPFNAADMDLWGDAVVGFQPVVVRATVAADEESILWQPEDQAVGTWLSDTLFDRMAVQKRGDRVLAHLALKGNFIWGAKDAALYLDGDAFGKAATDGSTALDYPSGDNRRGGDLRMWFWLQAGVAGLQSLTLSQSTVTGGGQVTGTITLSGRGGTQGVTVTLQSGATKALSAPQTVTVKAGELSATFPVTTSPVAADQTVTVTASLEGSASQVATLIVRAPRLVSLKLDSALAGIGAVGGTVTLSGPAPTGGIAVALQSKNPQVATVQQPTVTVAAGQTTARFTVNAVAPGQTDIVGMLGESHAATLQVLPRLAQLGLSAHAVVRGIAVTGTVSLTSGVPFPVTVALSSTNPAVVGLPGSVVVQAGSLSASFGVTTLAPGIAGIIASLTGSDSRSDTVQVFPALVGLAISPSSVAAFDQATGSVTLESPPPFAVTVALSSSNTSAVPVPASVLVQPGSLAASFIVTAGQVAVTTTATISASYSGVQGASARTDTLTVTPGGKFLKEKEIFKEKESAKLEGDIKTPAEGPLGPVGPVGPLLAAPGGQEGAPGAASEPGGATGRAFITARERPQVEGQAPSQPAVPDEEKPRARRRRQSPRPRG